MASPRKRRLLKLARAKKANLAPQAPVVFEDTGTIHTPTVEVVEVQPPAPAVEPPAPVVEPPAPAVEPVLKETKPAAPPKKTTRARRTRRAAKKEE